MEQIKLINSHNEVTIIDNAQKINVLLLRLCKSKSQIVLLEIPAFGVLTIGIGKGMGFIQFMSENNKPPYLLATLSDNKQNKDIFIEFDSGGTLTPIPIRKCIPIKIVVKLALDICTTKKLPEYVEWIEE